jgi:hypothetical protein
MRHAALMLLAVAVVVCCAVSIAEDAPPADPQPPAELEAYVLFNALMRVPPEHQAAVGRSMDGILAAMRAAGHEPSESARQFGAPAGGARSERMRAKMADTCQFSIVFRRKLKLSDASAMFATLCNGFAEDIAAGRISELTGFGFEFRFQKP